MVPAPSARVSRVPAYSGTRSPASLSLTGLSPSPAGFPKAVPLCCGSHLMRSEPCSARAAVWAPPVSLAATPGIDISFSSSGYLDVSVHRVPFRTLWIGVRIHRSSLCRFPHSEICGSTDMCSFPQLIAAYHVFLRLLVPRHPPCALFAWPLGSLPCCKYRNKYCLLYSISKQKFHFQLKTIF